MYLSGHSVELNWIVADHPGTQAILGRDLMWKSCAGDPLPPLQHSQVMRRQRILAAKGGTEVLEKATPNCARTDWPSLTGCLIVTAA